MIRPVFGGWDATEFAEESAVVEPVDPFEGGEFEVYDAEGVLPDPQRLPCGYRDYDPEDIARVRFVKQARLLGLTLDDIRQILALRDQGETPSTDKTTQKKEGTLR